MSIYINGQYFKKEEATISVYDHGLLYGDGIFEGIRLYNRSVFKLVEHIARLFESAQAIMLTIGMTPGELEQAVLETVHKSERHDGYIRIMVTRGKGSLGIHPRSCEKATIIIIVDAIQLYPKECYKKGIKVITSSLRRIAMDVVDPRIKTLNYMNNVLAKMEANQANCEEALLLNNQGHVAECTGDNVFMVKENQIFTPSSSQGALEGITKKTIMQLAEQMGSVVHEKALTCFDLYNADEVFLTGTAAEVIPVQSLDNRVIGTGKPGAITQKMMDAYRHLVGAASSNNNSFFK